MPNRKPLQQIFSKKQSGEKITMLTAYDYPMAALADEAGIDLILVGDSLANVVLGLDSTTQVSLEVMLHHAKAVTRAVKRALVLADMPFDAYQIDIDNVVFNARRFLFEGGCHGVKVEWFDRCPEVAASLKKGGVPVIGHVGLTPQTAQEFKVQGKDTASASAILNQAKALEAAGCMAMVLECVPEELARRMTQELRIPTIGIGAGKYCDGQVLVMHDMLGLTNRKVPKFVKKYADVSSLIINAIGQYKSEVEEGTFPGTEQTFHS